VKLPCLLREYRGDESLRSLAARAGISSGTLAQIELGRALPKDTHVPALEAAYGHPAWEWYPPLVLLAIEGDTG
jgi:transcriptional regulator with XRE-family HTH domain